MFGWLIDWESTINADDGQKCSSVSADSLEQSGIAESKKAEPFLTLPLI